MIVINLDTRHEVRSGEQITDKTGRTFIYQSIVMEPEEIGNTGGPFLGRIKVLDGQGRQLLPDPYPYDFGLAIVEGE